MPLTSGKHDQSFTATEPILWAELPPVAEPFVKWSTEVRRLEDLPRIVRRATKTALAHPTGPVFLSLPVDVLNAERDVDLLASTRVAPRIVGDHQAIDRAAALLAKAEQPRSEEHTSELQSRLHLVCRLLLEKKKKPEVSNEDRTQPGYNPRERQH